MIININKLNIYTSVVTEQHHLNSARKRHLHYAYLDWLCLIRSSWLLAYSNSLQLIDLLDVNAKETCLIGPLEKTCV